MNGHLIYVVGMVIVGALLWDTASTLVNDFQTALETFRAAAGG